MSEVQKRKKGQILNNSERQLILNLMHYLKEKNSGRSISEVIREISKATGCSERTIYKIRKEASKGIIVRTNRTRLRKKENKNSRNVKYDSYVKSAIRKKVHNYLLQNIPPTLNSILCLVNNDPELPNFKRSTLHTLLKEIGFVYEQKGKKSLLTERNDLVKSRQQYLADIRRFRSENRWIVYTGETLISLMKREVRKDAEEEDDKAVEDVAAAAEAAVVEQEASCSVFLGDPMACSGDLVTSAIMCTIDPASTAGLLDLNPVHSISCTADDIPLHTIIADTSYLLGEPSRLREQEQQTDDVSDDQALDMGDLGDASPSPSPNRPSARELRFTIMHAGSDNGFVQGADHVVLYKKKAEEIDSYEQWFLEKLLPKIPPNSVIVIDNNAPYHKRKEENIPDGSWKKQQIKNWLVSKNISVAEVTQKKELLSVVNNVRAMYSTQHKIDEVARQRGIIIMSLPPFHYELNPLNMVWAQVKYYVRANMKSFRIRKIKQLVREGFYTVTQVNWMNYVHHVRQMEDVLWTVDNQANQHLNDGCLVKNEMANQMQ